MDAGTVVLNTDDFAWTNHFQGHAVLNSGFGLEWASDPGFTITGFTVKYNLKFTGGTLGDWKGSGSFAAATGSSISWVYGDSPLASSVDVVNGDLRLVSYTLIAEGLVEGECNPPTDSGKCGAPQVWYGEIISKASLTSVEITPHVAAVPEPSTYLLMALGLAGLAAFKRRPPPQRRPEVPGQL